MNKGQEFGLLLIMTGGVIVTVLFIVSIAKLALLLYAKVDFIAGGFITGLIIAIVGMFVMRLSED